MLTLILEVQSSVVRGYLAIRSLAKHPSIIFSESLDISYRLEAGSVHLIKKTAQAVSEIIDSASKFISLHNKIGSIHYILSSPWIISQAKIISSDFKDATIINRQLILSMIDKEEGKTALNSEGRFVVVEEKIFDVKLNGYSTSKWENKSANQVEVSYVISLAGSSLIHKLQQLSAGIVPNKRAVFHSSLLLQHIGIAQIMPSLHSYIIVHIHGELTDVVVVERNYCVFFGTYPTGLQTIVRKIGQTLKIQTGIADSILSMSDNAYFDHSQSQKYSSIIKKMQNDWILEYANLFKQGGYKKTLPKKVIFSTRAHKNFFLDILKSSYPDIDLKILDVELSELYVLALNHLDK